MGEKFNKTTVGIATAVLAVMMVLSIREACPAYREAELFDVGYEQYLSSRPEKAVEAFTLFLEEFPQSSAKDAAMFWMAKCLIQLRREQEARNMFDRMMREFPESPLKPHAMREIETLSESGATKESEPIARGIYEGDERAEKKTEAREETVKLMANESAATHDGVLESVDREEEDLEGTHREVPQRREEETAGNYAESLAPPTGRTYIVQVAELSSEVKAFIDQYIQAYELGDIDRFMSFYSGSAVENNSLGYNEIRSGYQKNFQGSRYSYSLKDLLMEEKDGNVVLTGIYFIRRMQRGPLGIVAQGHITWTLTRENGVLRILRADYDVL